jgi:hypothetical protein
MTLNTILPRDGNSRTITEASALVQKVDDTTTSGYLYLGKAIPGSDDATGTAKAIWQIVRFNTTTGDKGFADSSVFFNKVWDDRDTYTYK